MSNYKVIGIIGGVGPWATVDFEKKILRVAKAPTDQQNPVIVSYNNSQIPDRTRALLHGGPSPVPELVKTAEKLIAAGAEVLCVPCHTAHAFWDEMVAGLQPYLRSNPAHPKLVNMIDEIVARVRSYIPTREKVGILASTGTVRSGVYDKALKAAGLVPVHVSPDAQEHLVMEAVYGRRGVKAGHFDEPAPLLARAADELVGLGAQAIVMACTEIPLALRSASVPLIDGNLVLAQAVVEAARINTVSTDGIVEKRLAVEVPAAGTEL